MSSSKKESAADIGFELKHRIVGAAFLLLFGALFLPWLLGPSSKESNSESYPDAVTAQASDEKSVQRETIVSGSDTSTPASRFDNDTDSLDTQMTDLQQAIESEEASDDVQEQVYVSKITPLDANQNNANDAQTQTVELDANVTTATQDDKSNSVPSSSQQDVAQAPAQIGDANEGPDSNQTQQVEVNLPAAQVVDAGGNEIKKLKLPEIEVGWAVQVGVFTDKGGAKKVVDDLKSKGFDPSTTIVDTNLGKATGTRIWLGPFAQRVDAAKEKTRLSQRTGEAGFIRAFP